MHVLHPQKVLVKASSANPALLMEQERAMHMDTEEKRSMLAFPGTARSRAYLELEALKLERRITPCSRPPKVTYALSMPRSENCMCTCSWERCSKTQRCDIGARSRVLQSWLRDLLERGSRYYDVWSEIYEPL